MNKSLKIGLIIVCFILLALVRMFQSELFNDPFIDFYKENYLQKQPPEIQQFSLYLNTAFRYFLNTIILYYSFWNDIKNKFIFINLLIILNLYNYTKQLLYIKY